MNSGILTYLFALRLYSDHLTKRFRILQAQYCDLSCRLYDTLERPRASQRAALWLGWWCTGCEGSKWSSLEFCHRDKKVGLFFFLSFSAFLDTKYIYTVSLVQALQKTSTHGKSHLKLLQWFIKNLLLQPQAIDQIFSHIYPTACRRSQPVFSTSISESIGLKANSLLLSHSHPNLFSPELCNSLSDTITFSHHALLHCYSAQMLTSLKKFNNSTLPIN